MSLIHVVCYDLISCVTINTISEKNTQPGKYPPMEYFHCRPRKSSTGPETSASKTFPRKTSTSGRFPPGKLLRAENSSCYTGRRPLAPRHRHPPRRPTYPKEQPKWRNRLSEPAIYPKFATWLGSHDPNTIMRKIETPIFQVEKPSTETTATTFSISGIKAQHELVAVAMHGVTTETRYYLKSRTLVTGIPMVVH